MAYSSECESKGSTDQSLFCFTAASKLSVASNDSYWGLESTNGSDDFDYVCHPAKGEVAVVCKRADG
jgi:hypothetical protein